MITITTELAAFGAACVFYTGYALGAYAYRKPAIKQIVIKVDDEFLYELDEAMVNKYAERRGVVWMPKGVADIISNKKNGQSAS